MSDHGPDGGIGLGGFRRYTWWSLTGTSGVVLVVVAGSRLLDRRDPGIPLWATVAGVVALAVTVVACAVLYTRRLDTVPDVSPASLTARPSTALPLQSPNPQPAALPPHTANPPPSPHTVRPPVAWMLVGGTGAAVVAGVLLVGQDGALWALAPATVVSVVATFLAPRRRWTLLAVAVVGAGALGGADALLEGTGTAPDTTPGGALARAVLFPPGLTVFVAWATFGMLWAWDVAERLNVARRMAAELAVTAERLRFAADLHDIQGHHLQVIALKSELAARLAATDHQRAEAEMREVRRLATDALTDTRAVVQGYRQTTLDTEIANASAVLAAAGIDVRADVRPDTRTADLSPGCLPPENLPPGDLPPDGLPPGAPRLRQLPADARHLLGLVVREATTNMLRHSQARHAEIACLLADGRVRLRIGNDGAAGDDSPRAAEGTGLRVLAERLAAAGGELRWGREDGGERFLVSVSLPVQPDLSTDGSAGAA